MQHSASAQASPPSLTSWALASAPARAASRSDGEPGSLLGEVERRQPACQPPAQLLELGALERRRERPQQRDRVAFLGEAHAGARPGSGSLPTMPTIGVG